MSIEEAAKTIRQLSRTGAMEAPTNDLCIVVKPNNFGRPTPENVLISTGIKLFNEHATDKRKRRNGREMANADFSLFPTGPIRNGLLVNVSTWNMGIIDLGNSLRILAMMAPTNDLRDFCITNTAIPCF